jgi:hypothetical protein
MTTPSADSDNPAPQRRRSVISIIGTALLGAVLGGIAMPFVTFFAALILAGLTTARTIRAAAPCGPAASRSLRYRFGR